MKQVVQSAGGGPVEVVEAPTPQLTNTSVLVRTEATLISSGTERAVTKLAQASLLDKARARPDLVRQVIQKAKTDGIKQTAAAVRSRLADDLALGYSGAGVVVEVGSAVRGIRVGDRVATGGGGFASHAEFQAVPWVLTAPLPSSVSSEQAAFSTVASVGLHGFRRAEVGVGARVVVVGLGLIGQLTARIAMASGCDVAGIDLNPAAVELASKHGVHGLIESGVDTTHEIIEWSRGRGADAVIITAGAQGDSRLIRSTPPRCRDRATVVAVGDIGLDLDRNDFYHKEIDLRLARSYGPGRYDRSYEEWGVDYPEGYVRWTEGRNLEAVVDLLASSRLTTQDLVTHRFAIDQAESAYGALDRPSEGALGVILQYPDADRQPSTTVELGQTSGSRRTSASHQQKVGIIGAGLFVRGTVLPGLREAGYERFVHIASASGLSATRLADRESISRASSDPLAVIADDDVDLVVIASPHSTHADLCAKALEAGKDVYCEKPLALNLEELQRVETALADSGNSLYLGFNRRHSPMIQEIHTVLSRSDGPLQIHYRINAGPLSDSHWYSNRLEGGRFVGEVCHFIDTCSALVGDLPVRASTLIAQTAGKRDSYHALIEYTDGSTASILYSSDCHPDTPKEHCEILGRGHTVVLDNYRKLTVDGKSAQARTGKGHIEGYKAMLDGHRSSLESMRLTLELNEQQRYRL